jgi:DNA-directed RNA polymerase specialized sigma24 family protein
MQTELVQRAMAGDHDAFAALVGAAWPKLYATAGFILGEEGYVQEAIQAALIRAWRDLPSLRDAARFEGWLYRIAITPVATRHGGASEGGSAKSRSTVTIRRHRSIRWPGWLSATRWIAPSRA